MDVAGAVLGFKYGDRVEEWMRGEQDDGVYEGRFRDHE